MEEVNQQVLREAHQACGDIETIRQQLLEARQRGDLNLAQQVEQELIRAEQVARECQRKLQQTTAGSLEGEQILQQITHDLTTCGQTLRHQ
ncbi:hypothetical protein [Guptibacillus hwajinpoensis]|uniref:hypothetical protein n=1 Tax=Guptibacillus hwajinpoensis TaxID=208199 RepID=UPI001CFE873E|nr:hypothetical protein [Pseudalkalibacillus hwajinpoensis]WLR59181.1 hypothetical protein LC071_18875 [Pseudalkalibacillus hwajinpoensis]